MGRLPMLVILGATGTGKSKLGLEMAAKFTGEVISADSMQVYKGLDIITNKVTPAEREQVPHHLLDLVHPLKEFTVIDFRNKALAAVEDIQRRGKLPVVVGGTNYYIESLLWKVLIDDTKDVSTLVLDRVQGKTAAASPESAEVPEKKRKTAGNKNLRELYRNVTNEELHKRLRILDPEMADSLHPNNRRKVVRSLEVLEQTGKRHSELLDEQKSSEGGSCLGGPLRYQGCVMLWLQCDQTVLDERLDGRVDEMIEQGLVQELQAFHQDYNKQRIADNNRDADYTRGIFQSIGFKEFHRYLLLDDSTRQSNDGKAMLEQGIVDLKLATRRYARKQIKWIRNRFLRQKDRQVPPVYGLDGTDPEQWKTKVHDIAAEIVAAHLDGTPPEVSPIPSEDELPNDHVSHTCTVCQRLFIGTLQWEAHRRSKKHERALKKQKRLEAFAANTLPTQDTPISS